VTRWLLGAVGILLVLGAVLALVALAVLHLLFVSLLHLPLPPGLLWRALGR